jgi:glutathione S-transferase
MAYRLYEFAASPFCVKIRSILDYKAVRYERIDAASPSVMRELRRRGGIGKVPAFEFDGTFVFDSTEIAYEIEKRYPSPSIFPQDKRQGALCHVLEDWADESLYWFGVYYRWMDPEGKASAGSIFPSGFFGQKILPRIVQATVKPQVRGQGLGRKTPEQVKRDLDRQLDKIEDLLVDHPYLLGDSPLLADFAVYGQLVYLRQTPAGEAEIASRETLVAYIEKIAGQERKE